MQNKSQQHQQSSKSTQNDQYNFNVINKNDNQQSNFQRRFFAFNNQYRFNVYSNNQQYQSDYQNRNYFNYLNYQNDYQNQNAEYDYSNNQSSNQYDQNQNRFSNVDALSSSNKLQIIVDFDTTTITINNSSNESNSFNQRQSFQLKFNQNDDY